MIPKNTMTQHKVMSRYFLVIDAIKYKTIKTFVDLKKKKKIKLNIYFKISPYHVIKVFLFVTE